MIEVFGHILFNVTRGVTEHYNREEPEFTAKCFDYNLLESLGHVRFSTNFAATQLWVLNDSRRPQHEMTDLRIFMTSVNIRKYKALSLRIDSVCVKRRKLRECVKAV